MNAPYIVEIPIGDVSSIITRLFLYKSGWVYFIRGNFEAYLINDKIKALYINKIYNSTEHQKICRDAQANIIHYLNYDTLVDNFYKNFINNPTPKDTTVKNKPHKRLIKL